MILGIIKWFVINALRSKQLHNKQNLNTCYPMGNDPFQRNTQKFALSVFVIERLDCTFFCPLPASHYILLTLETLIMPIQTNESRFLDQTYQISRTDMHLLQLSSLLIK